MYVEKPVLDDETWQRFDGREVFPGSMKRAAYTPSLTRSAAARFATGMLLPDSRDELPLDKEETHADTL